MLSLCVLDSCVWIFSKRGQEVRAKAHRNVMRKQILVSLHYQRTKKLLR